jgi:hypothetical protein
MRRTAVVVASALVTLFLSVASAVPQEKWARGTITALAADSLTLDVNGQAMTFTVNSSTDVIAPGASTKTREAQKLTGKKPMLTDVVKVGDSVEVRYTESAGAMVATIVRGGVSARPGTSKEGAKRIEGTVTEVTGTSLTVKPDKGEAMTFVVDAKIRVTGQGLGTMMREKKAAGESLKLTEAVAVGDRIDVTYMSRDGANHASDVRVIRKKAA